MSAAEAVVICQIKPMRMMDVRPHNAMLHEYLLGLGGTGYGCRTQIRMEFLKKDGFHILPQFDSVLDRTYACGLMNVPVPCPTPDDDFTPDLVRRRNEVEWPRLVGRADGRGAIHGHGWRW